MIEYLRPGRMVLHPLWLLGNALLLVNDRFFKPDFPTELVAGKISDFAGLFVFCITTISLHELISRRLLEANVIKLHCFSIGLVFAGTKTISFVRDIVENVWSIFLQLVYFWRNSQSRPSSVIVLDPTDLVAIAVVFVVPLFIRKVRGASNRQILMS